MTRRPVVPRVVRGCEPHGPDCVVLRVHARGDGPKWEMHLTAAQAGELANQLRGAA